MNTSFQCSHVSIHVIFSAISPALSFAVPMSLPEVRETQLLLTMQSNNIFLAFHFFLLYTNSKNSFFFISMLLIIELLLARVVRSFLQWGVKQLKISK